MSDNPLQDLLHLGTLVVRFFVCPACEHWFLVHAEDMLVVTVCPFCQHKIEVVEGETERIQ